MFVRKVTPSDDFEAIAAIYAASWKQAYRGIVPQEYLDSLDDTSWASVRQGKMYDAYVLMDDEKYAGVSTYRDARDEAMAGWGEVVSIYLLPAYWGRGFAEGLLKASVKGLMELGYRQIYLWVLKDNARARAFYHKHGFVPNGDHNIITIGGKDLPEVRYVHRPFSRSFFPDVSVI